MSEPKTIRMRPTGRWQSLSPAERGLYKASTSLARVRGDLVCPSLISVLKSIISKLLRTTATRIRQLGYSKARQLLELYERNGVFLWLPGMRGLLDDGRYVLWLGVRQMTLESLGVLG